MRLGAELLYHLAPEGPYDPWLGIGFGYEWLTSHADFSSGGAAQTFDGSLSGFEYLNLQLGVDYMATPGFGIGPFTTLTIGSYGNYDNTQTIAISGISQAGDRSGSVNDTAVHAWLIIGLRGTFVAL